MDLDMVFLSRLQFAVTVMFHYLFPPLTIGLGLLLVFMEGMYVKTGDPLYESMTKFWAKVFGISFALGVATGIVMEFQFGTNWATYSRFVGDVFGSALAAEGIFAFFLESGFLAILLFGWDRVSKRMHFFATLMVCLGSIFSAIWIVVANSWQQTPAGFHIVEAAGVARAEITSFWALVFNPSSVSRLLHVLLGAFIQGSFFVMSVTAFYILKRRHLEFARASFGIALALAAGASTLQLVAGDQSARLVARHQPAKLAAFEGVFKTANGVGLSLFGIPDPESETVKFSVAVPKLLSLLTHGKLDAEITGLDKFAPGDRPPVQIPFQSYHLMAALGTYFIALTWVAVFLLKRGRLFEKKWLMRIFVVSVIFPFIANQMGWVAAEVGRQPWTVYGLLRTADSVSKSVSASAVLGSLIMFSAVYLLLFLLFLFVLDRKIRGGPEEPAGEEFPEKPGPRGLVDAVRRRGRAEYGLVEAHEEKRNAQ